jgi:hypothetical protein
MGHCGSTVFVTHIVRFDSTIILQQKNKNKHGFEAGEEDEQSDLSVRFRNHKMLYNFNVLLNFE